MLLNLSGSHEPFCILNIILLIDSASHTGVGRSRVERKAFTLNALKLFGKLFHSRNSKVGIVRICMSKVRPASAHVDRNPPSRRKP
jgi:hypothetical protein